MNDHEIDRYIVEALEPKIDPETYERVRQATHTALTAELRNASSQESYRRYEPPARTRPRLRVALIVVGLLTLTSSVAIGATKVASFFGDDPARPAAQIDAFDEGRTQLGVFDDDQGTIPAVFKRSVHNALASAHALSALDDKLLGPEWLRNLATLRADDFTYQVLAAPTDSGDICYSGVLVAGGFPSQMTSCAPALSSDAPVVSWGENIDRQRVVIAGIVSDDVRSVEIRTEDTSWPATMGENGFVWTGPATGSERMVLVRLRDGSELSLLAPVL